MDVLQRYVSRQPLEVEAFFAIVDTTAELVGVSEKYWSSLGLNGARIRILVEIAKAGGSILPSVLAARIGVTKANISVLLIPLEQQGFTRSAADPQDGRKRRVLLTESGEKLLLDVLPGNRAVVSERMNGLDEEEIELLMSLLRKVRRKKE
ncbi:MarR family transcriptional regulator [Cohnella sp. CIP 111063]|uniref:MarR family winged helix-turn-helix transcriptional regulator n=1 Tax=unclassified Cohnella TaxID=2636738 RepID=UPI000B8BDBFA|nr:MULTISPECIES: MarR family transcriptional regulator [unclassified Cohnella]OXS52901.1 MarR family transcriptional regulator [Cohnella sp. CIP 111063]PRX60152.1 DNA-binding MarR family transcriptional regulator [Cohnella sp. SGD-V74]